MAPLTEAVGLRFLISSSKIYVSRFGFTASWISQALNSLMRTRIVDIADSFTKELDSALKI